MTISDLLKFGTDVKLDEQVTKNKILDFLVDQRQKYGSFNFDQMPIPRDSLEVVGLVLENLEG